MELRATPLPLSPPGEGAPGRDARFLGLTLGALAGLSALLLGAALWLCDGAWVYTLDDPYIHLALARGLAGGHYGLQAGEAAAPSSSILWPLLLAPFAASPFFEQVPLAINLVCLLATGALVHRFFARRVGGEAAAFLTLCFVLALNLLGLVFTGLEHSLQVLGVTLVAVRLAGMRVPLPLFFASLVLLPAIRYEDLAISLPVLGWLAWRERAWPPLGALAMLALILGGFSLFLVSLGLHPLPSSVLAKTGLPVSDEGLWGFLRSMRNTARDNVGGMPLHTLALVLVAALPGLRRRAPWVLPALLLPALLIYAFGRSGWYGRYQVHFLVYGGLLMADLLLRGAGAAFVARRFRAVGLLYLAAHAPLAWCTLSTPLAAQNVYRQQWQMAELVRRLDAPVAVNDLGLVVLRSRQPVLDLWGLGSQAALALRRQDPGLGWLGPLLQRRGVRHAFIYDAWFPRRPAHWIRVGSLRLPGARISVAEREVTLYATDAAAARALREALHGYRAASPLAARLARIEDPLP